MAKTKRTFHILKNFKALGYRTPWWIIGNFFSKGQSERLKNENGGTSKWRKGK
jgi:hypothetical protein